jgi:hypothetical protein
MLFPSMPTYRIGMYGMLWNMFLNAASFQGVSWYNNILVQRFELLAKEDPFESEFICQASTQCLPDRTNIADFQNSINNEYSVNVTIHSGYLYISGNELVYDFTIPCSVTCRGECLCYCCVPNIDNNLTINIPTSQYYY